MASGRPSLTCGIGKSVWICVEVLVLCSWKRNKMETDCLRKRDVVWEESGADLFSTERGSKTQMESISMYI
jgi:hypothetical protein